MRHKKVQKRQTEADRVYDSLMATKFINRLMKDGKKAVAQGVFYRTLDIIAKTSPDAILVFDQALQNVGPKQEIKARRVGGASYQIPMEVRGERRMSLAIRWIIEAARARSNKEFHKFEEKLAAELLAASQNQGEAIKKRDNVQRMADANKAFSHFRF